MIYMTYAYCEGCYNMYTNLHQITEEQFLDAVKGAFTSDYIKIARTGDNTMLLTYIDYDCEACEVDESLPRG